MSGYIVVKKDFVSPETKSLCQNKQLTSGKAYFLCKSMESPIVYEFAGKECVKKYTNMDLSTIPDFTKSLIVNFEKEELNKKRICGEYLDKQGSMSKSAVALTYLILRQDKLRDFKNISHDKLRVYYQEYLDTQKLSNDAIVHILNIEKCAKTPPKLKLNNLLTCYAYKYKMHSALEYVSSEGKVFILSLLTSLRTYYHLTEKQILGLLKWFQHIPHKEFRESKIKNWLKIS